MMCINSLQVMALPAGAHAIRMISQGKDATALLPHINACEYTKQLNALESQVRRRKYIGFPFRLFMLKLLRS